MKKIILLTGILGLMSVQLSAQIKEEKIKELFGLMQTEKMIDAMMDNMKNVFGNSRSRNMTPANDSIYHVFLKNELRDLSKKMYAKDMVDIYSKHFSLSEIQKYIDFYKTPEGQKMVEVMPAMQKDIMTNMMATDVPVLTEKLKKKLEELNN